MQGNTTQGTPISIDSVLEQRGSRYGDFKTLAEISQKMEDVMRATPGWAGLAPWMKESLKMNVHKIARILNGDPFYKDNWTDLAGYAQLVSRELKED